LPDFGFIKTLLVSGGAGAGCEEMMAKKRPLEGLIQGEVLYGVPMAEYTSFRVGGPVDFLAFPADPEDLRTLLRWCRVEGVPYFILGKGTNLLVRDGGIRGLAINLSRGFQRLAVIDEGAGESAVVAEAGEALARFVDFSWQNNLAGIEFAAGIPGSVGGGIFMNAGAFRREMKDVLTSISLMNSLGQVSERKVEDTGFSYRSMGIQKGEVILGGKFILQRGKGEETRARIEEIRRARLAKQPYDLPSAGSVFKNPELAPAGKLIEEAGLKGSRIGDAQVSEKHANFIVNLGKATARDILELVERVRERVQREKGILLEMEVQVAGEKY
jgi:UDP-N-acetylmuramate dehydrogenase